MPVLALAPAAATAFWGATAAGVTAGTQLYAAHRQGSAADNAARLQTTSANRAAELQAQSAREALDYTKEQDTLTRASADKAQRLNYEQYADRQRRIGTLGTLLGYGGRNPPAYDSSINPSPAASQGAPANGAVPQRPGDLAAALKVANDTAYGFAKHTDAGYWQALWSKDPEYAFRRMLGEGAGGADVARIGPYAGAGSAAPAAAKAVAPRAPVSTARPNGIAAYAYAQPRTPNKYVATGRL